MSNEARKANATLNDIIDGRSNKRFDPTGMSLAFIVNLSVAQVSPGGSIAALGCSRCVVKAEAKTCLLLAARGSFSIQLNLSLSGCAAALRGLLDAMRRTLNHFCQGGRRALPRSGNGQPNKSLERSGNSVAFIRETWMLVTIFAARSIPALGACLCRTIIVYERLRAISQH